MDDIPSEYSCKVCLEVDCKEKYDKLIEMNELREIKKQISK